MLRTKIILKPFWSQLEISFRIHSLTNLVACKTSSPLGLKEFQALSKRISPTQCRIYISITKYKFKEKPL